MSEVQSMLDDYLQKLWNQKDLSVIEQYVSTRIQIQSSIGQTFGISGMKQLAEKWLQAFPDLQCDFFQYLEEGNTIVSYWRAVATHQGTFLNIPATGKVVQYEGFTSYKVKEMKIIEHSAVLDLQQIIDCIA